MFLIKLISFKKISIWVTEFRALCFLLSRIMLQLLKNNDIITYLHINTWSAMVTETAWRCQCKQLETYLSVHWLLQCKSVTVSSLTSLCPAIQLEWLLLSRGFCTDGQLANERSSLAFDLVSDDSSHCRSTFCLCSCSIWLGVRMLLIIFSLFSALHARNFQILFSFAFFSSICAEIKQQKITVDNKKWTSPTWI